MSETDKNDIVNDKDAEGTSETNKTKEKFWESEWMLRPCEMYNSEFKVCNSFRGKFNQLFVDGETADCSQWKVDYNNCTKWKKLDDQQAYEDLVASEKVRRVQRLKGHYMNDVWTRREAPPTDWNAPLPKWLEERDSGTFLAAKQQQISTGKDREIELYMPSACTIL
ncbi:synaptic plasticity regulator PANTS [Diachasmimorpha longicaudata]|uniref:synaptic plasticity regulator PANTS n=1 Tax=Diachasmimorpha longicaudata TaxID=58733 RepID=UPI0030B8D154